MKKLFYLPSLLLALVLFSCGGHSQKGAFTTSGAAPGPGQSAVQDADSNPNIVQVAVGSPDHSTLVTALKAANYVDALTNVGPFTVFAPTNTAFDALASGTLDELVKPENQRKLRDILEYHVLLGVYKTGDFVNGRGLGTADGRSIAVMVTEDGTVTINGAKIVGTVQASNGIIHVVDQVLLPE
ncbi:fasciclin domain-containing protein [Algoriphagus sp. CAU 1675]|uniref:fasciclin domain-containing protein n=1 Tax=Algoriphagus sp. CAU 1675 TaxID=3032597 RepID=UPI0023D9D296|nr:fasciclin domain-containing protein [Algoriphagus sp. CAU 1675]MDF2156514.1 fasciclin domain-containing protein [Algoriphagus sp. CAU 1675]